MPLGTVGRGVWRAYIGLIETPTEVSKGCLIVFPYDLPMEDKKALIETPREFLQGLFLEILNHIISTYVTFVFIFIVHDSSFRV